MQVQNTNKRKRGTVIVAVLCAVLELAIAPNISLFSGHINFCFIFCACIALSQGGPAGTIAGFLSGLFFDLCATSPVGLMALLMTATCYFMGTGVRNRFAEDRVEPLRIFLIGCAAVSIGYGLAMLLVGEATSFVDVVLMRALPSFVLTSIAFIPFLFSYARKQSTTTMFSGSSTVFGSGRSNFGGGK